MQRLSRWVGWVLQTAVIWSGVVWVLKWNHINPAHMSWWTVWGPGLGALAVLVGLLTFLGVLAVWVETTEGKRAKAKRE